MNKEQLDEIFTKEVADKIVEIKSDDVTFDMLSNGQKKAFVTIARLIMRNFDKTYNKKKSEPKNLMEMFKPEKKHITLNGPAGT